MSAKTGARRPAGAGGLQRKWAGIVNDQTWVQHFNEGVALFTAGRTAEAIERFRSVVALQPGVVQAHMNIGTLLRLQGRTAEALDPLRETVRLKPDHADALASLAQAHMELRQGNEALEVYRRLLAVKPDYPGVLLQLGNLFMQGDLQDWGETCYRRAVALDPGSATPYNNLGASLTSQLRTGEAAAVYRRGLRIETENAEYHKNLGTCLMLGGDYAEGTREYEWRHRQSVWKWNRSFPGIPEWDGSPLAGKTILVHFEQGLGDSFQYIRYMPVLKAMGARTIFECQPVLKRILSTAPGVDVLVAKGEPLPPFDCYITLMSLMRLLGTTPDTVPGGVPYIHAEPALKERWGARMAPGEFRIGINWQGNETAKSIPLEMFVPISQIPGVRLYSLQKVNGLGQLEALRGRLSLVDWTAEMDTGSDGFIDTAAVMANMDLILTCDTSVAHMAGAMGCPTWMVLKWFADWRWLLHRLDCPWYPTMRVFRMVRKNDWAEAMGRVTAELAALVSAKQVKGQAAGA